MTERLQLQAPGVVRVPSWEQYPWLRAGFSTRDRGASQVYGEGELNFGYTREDDPEAVAANRAALVQEIAGAAPMQLVVVQQVHGDVVLDLEEEPGPWMDPQGRGTLRGDGLMCRRSSVLLGIQTADCVPVLVVDTRLRAVAALHAGWRGTAAGISDKAIAALRFFYGSRPEDLEAAIGPCIGPCCFEVGEEVREAFRARCSSDAEQLFVPSGGREGRLILDLVEANRSQLQRAGVPASAVHSLAECTACSRTPAGRRRFFSHRAEQGRTGRMLSVIGTVPD